jgi:hypothetical protein
MRQRTKTNTWNMRAAQADKANIANLARRLGCSESEAVRKAIRHTLETMKKIEKDRLPR